MPCCRRVYVAVAAPCPAVGGLPGRRGILLAAGLYSGQMLVAPPHSRRGHRCHAGWVIPLSIPAWLWAGEGDVVAGGGACCGAVAVDVDAGVGCSGGELVGEECPAGVGGGGVGVVARGAVVQLGAQDGGASVGADPAVEGVGGVGGQAGDDLFDGSVAAGGCGDLCGVGAGVGVGGGDGGLVGVAPAGLRRRVGARLA